MRVNIKSRGWLLVSLALVCGLVVFNQWQHAVGVNAMIPVLNNDWNPYGHQPSYLDEYAYKASAQRFEKYITQSSPSIDLLAEEIMKTERENKLRRNPERAKRVAELLLGAYHHPSR